MIDQDAPHDARSYAHEMCSTVPVPGLIAHQPHVGLVHQGGRLQGVARAFASQVVPGQGAQLWENELKQLFRRLSIAAAHLLEKQCNFVRVGSHAAHDGAYLHPEVYRF